LQSASPTTAIYATVKADITAAVLPIFSYSLFDFLFNLDNGCWAANFLTVAQLDS